MQIRVLRVVEERDLHNGDIEGIGGRIEGCMFESNESANSSNQSVCFGWQRFTRSLLSAERRHTDHEPGPDPMIQPSLHSFDLHTCRPQQLSNPLRHRRTAPIWELQIVVPWRKAREVIDDIRMLSDIDADFSGGRSLPMGREDDNGFGFHFRRDFLAYGGHMGVGGVGGVDGEIGTADAEEVDGHGVGNTAAAVTVVT